MPAMLGATRVAGYHLTVYRDLWKLNLLSSLVQPLLYLLGLGVGVGALVDANTAGSDELGGVPYAAYVAPGLLITAAMAVSAFESMWAVRGGVEWQRTYHAMAATPLGAADIVLGHALWMAARALIGGTAVAAVMALFPETRSLGLVPAVGVGAVVAMAFAMPLMAYSVTARDDGAFAAIQRFVIIPLFLFGGAFYPITQLPTVVQRVVQFFPLWHGIEVARMFFDRAVDWPVACAQMAYVWLWVIVGAVIARRRLSGVLYP